MSSRRALGAGAAALCAGLLSAGVAQASPAMPTGPVPVVPGDTVVRPHAVVATPDGKIYVAEFGYFAEETPPGGGYERRVFVYTPNAGSPGGYRKDPVAGTGEPCPGGDSGAACGDGGPATQARLGHVSGMAVDKDGRVYLAENFWNRIRVVGTDGDIRTVEGAPRGLNTPEGLAYDATTDTVLVTDKRNDRLLSFDAGDGGPTRWRTVAGQYSGKATDVPGARCASPTDPCGDGGPATAARLIEPGAVAVDEAGTIYLADSKAYRIRKIDRDGTISAFAGNGTVCGQFDPCGDGGPAVDASFGDPREGVDGEGPFGVATSPDGAVYISDSDIDRIRRVLPDGTIDTVATARHPKAAYALRTASGHDLIVPEWDINRVSRVRGIDRFDLTVVKAGTGTGTVSGPGIDCGTDCTEPAGGTTVTLRATPAAGSSFAGWSGAGCTGTGTCTVNVDATRTVTASFTRDTPPPPAQRRLTATVTGSGTVTGGGLTCGAVCTATHPDGTAVQLTATPAAGHRFVRWTGACAGTAPACGLTLGSDATAGAVFEAVPVTPPAPKPPTTPPVVEPPVKPQPPTATPLRLTASVVGSRTLKRGASLRLRYELSTRATLTLEVRPAKGRVQRLALGTRKAGTGTVTWNGRLRGKRVAGSYTLVLVAKAGAVTKRTSVKVAVRR